MPETCKFIIGIYKKTTNSQDSLAETYAELKDNKRAFKNYEQSFKLNPQNKNAEQQIKILKSKL